jgi:tetratricopeptide (TPR) repeat protein
MYTDILFRTNQVKDAIEKARVATENDPDNIQSHYWYGQLLARSTLAPEVSAEQRNEALDKAIQAMHRVVELQPESPDAWFFLINCYATQNKLDLAQKTLRDAQLSLNGDNLQEFLAKSYATLGRWFDAETMYRSVYEVTPQDTARAQQLAAFYLSSSYQMPDRQLKATPLINQILRAGAEGKLVANDANLLWARRMAARMLAATGDYQNLLKAEKLLNANSQGGAMSIEDNLEMAQILHTRPEPGSRQKAIRLLEEVREVQRLSEQAEIMLGNLYYLTRPWNAYYSQMERTVARYPNSVAARDAFARKLLARGDQQSINVATDQIEKVRQLAPDSTGAFDLAVRLASKIGRQQQVRDLLLRKLPRIDPAKELDQRQEQTQLFFAGLLVELGDLDSAEQIYRDLSKRDPTKSYGLAMFLGTHRGVDQCFAHLNEIYQPDRIAQIVGVALSVIREKRDQVGDKYDADIKRWLDRGLLENPDSITLLMLQADFLDILKQYDEAATVYRKLLARDDLTGQRRAFALNNLSYLIALEGKAAGSNEDPLKLVEEAAQILGPNSDILDTRAVVYMARGDYQQAIEDLTLSVTDNPTASKYFHLAQAYLAARENRAALDAWKKAEELDLGPDSINRMEHEKYEATKRQIEQLRSGASGASVTRSEALRPAG